MKRKNILYIIAVCILLVVSIAVALCTGRGKNVETERSTQPSFVGTEPSAPGTTISQMPATTVPTEPGTTVPTEPGTTVPTEPGTTVPDEPVLPPEKMEVSGAVQWNDGNDQDGKRPERVEVRLWADGKEVATQTVTATENWTFCFAELDRFASGKQIVYTITQDAVAGYTTNVEGYAVTNGYTPQQTQITVSKTWVDDENRDGKRPTSITIHLYKNGKAYKAVTLNGENAWCYTFEDLPVYENGKEISYSIREDAVEGYTTTYEGFHVINRYTPEETSVSGAVQWNDGNNQDGKRPESVAVRLWADGKEVATQTVTAAENWTFCFTELDRFANGKQIVYSITQDAVEGYATSSEGFTVTNSYTPQQIGITVSATWADNDNQDGKRPQSTTVRLNKDGREYKVATLTANTGWQYTFENLPVYENGQKIVYTITQDAEEGYTFAVEGFCIAGTHEPEKTEISGDVTWEDGNNQDGKRPTSITLNLLADGEKVQSVAVSATANWNYAFRDLPVYKQGKQIVYTITAENAEGYSMVVNNFHVVGTHQPEKITVSGSVTWNDGNNQDGKRPKSVTIHLLANGEKVKSKAVTSAEGWKYSFAELDKYANGQEILYSISVEAVENYTIEWNGFVLTLCYTPQLADITVQGIWADNNDQDGKRPVSITIRLWANGVECLAKVVTAADDWKCTFEDLPVYQDGVKILYVATEDQVPEYTTSYDGFCVTNTYTPGKIQISGAATWNDGNNRDGKRPAGITIRLWANGVEVRSVTVTEKEHWIWNFADLDQYAGGKEIVYTITQDAVAGYTTSVAGFNATNSYEPEVTSVSGSVRWDDQNDQDGKRPAFVTIRLYKNGNACDVMILRGETEWRYAFENLPAYENGKKIAYSISEDVVAGYTTSVAGFDITNSYEPEEISVSGAVQWNDGNDQDGKRPERVEVRLWADGKEVATQTVTATENWTFCFAELDRFASGKQIVYTITQDAVAGYTTNVEGYAVTNGYTPQQTQITVSKTWVDDENRDGKRPTSITIHLYKNGKAYKAVTLNGENAWCYTFEDLPVYENGKEISYSIREDAVEGYTTTYEGFHVINRYTPEETSVSGAVQWNDGNNQDGKRPESVAVRLWADGKEVATQTVTAAENWTFCFTELDRFANGKQIVYSITQDAVEGYATSSEGFTVTNSYTPQQIGITVSATWADNDNQDGKRPQSTTVRLNKDGREYKVATLTANTGWQYTFENLPVYENGQKIVYTITQDAEEGYTFAVEGFCIAGTHEPEKTEISGDVTWEDGNNQDGKRPTSITLNLLADGEKVQSVAVSATANWNYAFRDLPVYKQGKQIVYTITAENAEGYSMVVNNFHVVGTHQPEKITVSGSVTWNDGNNQDGKRPKSVTIHLLANGEKVKSKAVTSAEGWKYSFAELDKYANGQEILYSISVEAVENYTTQCEGFDVINSRIPQEDGFSIILRPEASGEQVKSNDVAIIDYSNVVDGYVMVRYTAETAVRLKVQVIGPSSTTYTYNIDVGQWEVFPLSDGNGTYRIRILEQVVDNRYATVLSLSTAVTMADEYAPFLRPNQYVNYENATKTVSTGAELCRGKTNLLDKVEVIYQYVVKTLSYDYDKAATVQSGYLPDLDAVLAEKKGICFDYAALMTAMLRSQGIPCKLVVGYAGTGYHAWISVWSEETGWVDGVVYFNGTTWQRMDPTFMSAAGGSQSIVNFIKNDANYTIKYLY